MTVPSWPEPILPAGTVDAIMLAVIHATAFPAAEAWGPDAIALSLELPGAFGLFRPGGGMVLCRVGAAEAEVLTLAVVPGARRQGLGGALLGNAMATAARAGAVEMFLEVSVANRAALSLYRRNGFAEVGRRARYYADGSDALVLRAEISRPDAAAAT